MAKSRLRSVLRPVAAALLVIGATWGSVRFVWELHGPEAPRDDGPPAAPGARGPALVAGAGGGGGGGGDFGRPARAAALPAPAQLHCTVVCLPGGEPVTGARLDFLAPDGGVVTRGTTGADGAVVVALPAGVSGSMVARVDAAGLYPVPVEPDSIAISAGSRVTVAVATARRVTLRCVESGTGAAVPGARALLVSSGVAVGESDASGLLAADLPGTGAVLRTEARGFLPDERRLAPPASASGPPVVVELLRIAMSAPFAARIVRADGTPAAGAPFRIEARRLAGGRATRRTLGAAVDGLAGRTDGDGRIAVAFPAAGLYDLIVEQEGRPPFVRTITFEGRGAGVPEEIRLPREWTVAGRILSQDGAPVPGAELSVLAGGRTHRMPVAGDGSFQGVIAADAGPVVFEASSGERPVAVLEVARPEDLTPEATIVLGPGGTLRGRILGSGGSAAVACRVSVSVAAADRRKAVSRIALTGDDGSFIVRGLPPGGRLTVTAIPAADGETETRGGRRRSSRLVDCDNPVTTHGEERDLGDLRIPPR